jgi:hypothetical protein
LKSTRRLASSRFWNSSLWFGLDFIRYHIPILEICMDAAIRDAKVKLARVVKHIEEIQSCVDAYSARYPHEILSSPQGKTRFTVAAPEALDIAAIAGEAVYQMRSALDHLAFGLVQRNASGGKLRARWEDECQFPIWLTIKSGKKPPLPYNEFNSMVPSISIPAFTFLESIQPYYGIGATNNSLGILRKLSNIDKHRHLATTRHRGQLHQSRLHRSGIRGSMTMAVDHGTEIDMGGEAFPNDPPVEVLSVLSHFVTFNEPAVGNACSPPVQCILETILDEINGVIVPAFEKFID